MYFIFPFSLNDIQKKLGDTLERVVSQHSPNQVSQLSKDEITMFLKKYDIV